MLHGIPHRYRLPHALLRLACLVSLMTLAAWSTCRAAADDAAELEHQVKAAFLYKFAGYVDWPADRFQDPASPIVIAVMGDDAIAAELRDLVDGRSVQERPIMVRRIQAGESLADVHILFIGRTESARMERMLAAVHRHSILLVTDFQGAIMRGSAINFIIADRRLRFEVSIPAAEESGLKLSSRLLAVALRIRTGTP
jgi:hypothetical protein